MDARHERLELGDELAGGPGRKVRFDAEQHRLKPFLFEPAAPLGDAPLAGDVAQRLAADQAERLARAAHEPDSGSALASSTSASNRRQSSSNVPARSEYPAASRTRRSRADHAASTGARAAPKPRSPAAIPPQLVDQPVTRQRDAVGHQQQRQQRTLTAARERDRLPSRSSTTGPSTPNLQTPLGHPAPQISRAPGPRKGDLWRSFGARLGACGSGCTDINSTFPLKDRHDGSLQPDARHTRDGFRRNCWRTRPGRSRNGRERPADGGQHWCTAPTWPTCACSPSRSRSTAVPRYTATCRQAVRATVLSQLMLPDATVAVRVDPEPTAAASRSRSTRHPQPTSTHSHQGDTHARR